MATDGGVQNPAGLASPGDLAYPGDAPVVPPDTGTGGGTDTGGGTGGNTGGGTGGTDTGNGGTGGGGGTTPPPPPSSELVDLVDSAIVGMTELRVGLVAALEAAAAGPSREEKDAAAADLTACDQVLRELRRAAALLATLAAT